MTSVTVKRITVCRTQDTDSSENVGSDDTVHIAEDEAANLAKSSLCIRNERLAHKDSIDHVAGESPKRAVRSVLVKSRRNYPTKGVKAFLCHPAKSFVANEPRKVSRNSLLTQPSTKPNVLTLNHEQGCKSISEKASNSTALGAAQSEKSSPAKRLPNCSFDDAATSRKKAFSSFIALRADHMQSEEDVSCYLPRYESGVEERWYLDLSLHVKEVQSKLRLSGKRNTCLNLYLNANKDIHASSRGDSKRVGCSATNFDEEKSSRGKCRSMRSLQHKLLGVVDPIGSFIIPLNKAYVESIDSLFNLNFLKKIKYESKKQKYEDSLILALRKMKEIVKDAWRVWQDKRMLKEEITREEISRVLNVHYYDGLKPEEYKIHISIFNHPLIY